MRALHEIFRAAEAGDHALEPLDGRAALERALHAAAPCVNVVREAGEGQELCAERNRYTIEPFVALRAGQIIDGVAHFDRVAGGARERLVHVGDE